MIQENQLHLSNFLCQSGTRLLEHSPCLWAARALLETDLVAGRHSSKAREMVHRQDLAGPNPLEIVDAVAIEQR